MSPLADEMKPALAQIDVDFSKCTVPMTCKKCLLLCPQLVFQLVTLKDEKFKETAITDAGAYIVLPLHRWKCTLCGVCAEECPEDAITLTSRRG
ncbi:MAG: 4Fe-4S dicluster domain-containing protein [Actinomycetota bacterium]